jgi:hypothetical protein
MRIVIALGLVVSLLVCGSLPAVVADSPLPPIIPLTGVDPSAATGERKWISLDSSQAPGSAAAIRLDMDASNQQRTVFDLTIPGFWKNSKLGEDGRVYQQIEIPGLGSHNHMGWPDLPLYRFQLALPFRQGEVRMSGHVRELRRFEDILVWPQPVPELDGEKGSGTPEQFVVDRKHYGSQVTWPSAHSPERYEIGRALRGIPAIQGEAWPVQWNPARRELLVAAKVTYVVEHASDAEAFEPITQERYSLAAKRFLNWRSLEGTFVPNLKVYNADFLFIYPHSGYSDEIRPLVNQKRARGFKVTEMSLAEEIGASSCNQIRSVIQTWEAAIPAWRDAYALLVGDTDVIPHCTSPSGDQTDDLYASTNGDDLEEEIYLGRLSVDSEADLANQVNKILSYENHPNLFCCYNRVGLWAHKEDAPGKYVGAHERVRSFSYSDPPIFETFYGSQTGVTGADVGNRVSNGVGILAYRGHGSRDATATDWNQAGEYFQGGDIATLANPLSRAPVVWSFACTNARLDTSDAVAEEWMGLADAGAAAYYGATRTSYTDQNHVLDEWMFRAVYDEGVLTQSHAIERGESQMAALTGSRNAWMYLLLGDPDMKIRTRSPSNIVIKTPESIKICKGCDLPIYVKDERGNPVRNALVGLWKPAVRDISGGAGETWVNGYTDKQGYIALPYTALTTGELFYSVEDTEGNSVFNWLQVAK